MYKNSHIPYLLGGFNPSEKYQSKWEPSPNKMKIKDI